ncbi:chromate transporter [Leptothoe sp. PORK10 BA2]|uniref:chromate transporter n=1 Tax=Leptothoe sp. PORK10 BA2 TaxID=3110254 RepID=UPI002B21B01A|nr:chromate transporter [Leptothoe sp. PORK10 BA2]MEA5464837.1 chromate transporter [Leptothoe sp. PORK10 BA2]
MTNATEPQESLQSQSQPQYSLWQLVLYFLKLGAWGFGGPIALIGYMKRDLVDERNWISESDYKEGLSLAQLAPGPLAEQLAIYMGYVHYGIWGATLTGLVFPLPAFLMVLALGWAYTVYGGLPWMQAVFYTVGATVIGIIANSSYKLTVKTIGKEWLFWGIYIISAAVTAITESEKILLILGAGILVWFVKAPPQDWGTGKRLSGFVIPTLLTTLTTAPAATSVTLWNIFTFFGQAGAFVFGSGLAIVPFLYGGLVNDLQWLNSQEFLDAVAVAMITPGPIVITVGFIGFLVAGLSGAVVATLATFLPCYLFTIIPAPYFKKHGKQPAVAAFVEGVTVAAIGAITGAVIVLGRRSLVDIPTIAIAVITLILLLTFKKKLPEPLIVIVSAVIGLVIYPLTHSA